MPACDICTRPFSRRSDMLRHKHSKHGITDSLYTCTICPKSFPIKHNLTRHMLTHKDPLYKCMCGKPFHRSDLLAKHQRRCQKTSADANVCDICGTPFVQKCHLTRHTKVCVVKRDASRIKEASAEYRRRLETGSRIERILKTCPDTLEEALDGCDKACLKLYRKRSLGYSFEHGTSLQSHLPDLAPPPRL